MRGQIKSTNYMSTVAELYVLYNISNAGLTESYIFREATFNETINRYGKGKFTIVAFLNR
jgi:hypothetical protein